MIMLFAALSFPFLFLIAYISVRLIQPDVIYVPSLMNVVLVFVTLWLSLFIRNGYARGICFFWSIWFLFGSLSLFAQNQLSSGLNYKVDPDAANQYYLYCIMAAVLVMFALDRTIGLNAPRSPVPLVRGSNVLVWILLLGFPLLYATSVYLATGDIPMFSGRNVSAAMYDVDYGPLHGFGVFVSVAAIATLEKASDRASVMGRGWLRFATLNLVGLLLLVAAMDGRRALTTFALFGIILFVSARPSRTAQRIQVVLVAAFGLVGYVAAAAVRTGSEASQAFNSFWSPLATIGTEYRDYVYGFVRFARADVLGAGYDWVGSTVSTMIPGGILTIVGVDKSVLQQTDSARTLMGFWNVDLGIRIGLPGELWFAFGMWGIAIFAVFAVAVYAIANLALRSDHFVYRAVLLSVLGIWATSVLGQSTVTFGLLLPLLYLSFVVLVVEQVSGRRIRQTRMPVKATRDGIDA